MRIIDGHLDLAYNATKGRDLSLGLADLRLADPVEDQLATVSLPELRAAEVAICFGTVYVYRYADHAGARAQALAQLEQYGRWQDAGLIRLLTSRASVKAHLAEENPPLGVVLLMEGAEPIRDAADLPFWVERGVRVIGPAWERTRFAGGTDTPGPLTELGRELVQAIQELNLTMDASHLDDAAFWDAAEIGPRMIASHSNSRTLVPGKNRHLTDEMARAVVATGGVIGLVFLNRFIDAGWQEGDQTPLPRLLAHAEHYARLVGWEHVALGTDLDGGFGAEKTPLGVDRYTEVGRFLELLPPEQREAVAWKNWARWLVEYL